MKKVLALLTCTLLMVGVLAACGQGAPAPSANTAPNTAQPADSQAGSDLTEVDYSTQEPYTVHLMMSADAPDADMVAAALSELSVAKFNTTIELTMVGWGSYLQQLNLMLSSGEDFDAFANMGYTSNYVANGQVIPLDDLLAEYGQDTLNAISEEDWACNTIDGKIYSIPSNKDKASNFGVSFTKSMLDELGVSPADIKTLDDVHDVLVKATEAFPNVYGMASGMGNMWSRIPFADNLGTINYLGVILDGYGDDLTVENLYASDEYYEIVELMYQWNQEGLLMPDGATNTETVGSLRTAGMLFASFSHMKPGFDEQETRAGGVETVSIEIWPAVSYTSDAAKGWSIAANSKQPERAMQILDWLYNDFDASNISLYGVEGVHWEIKDEALGLVGFPDGSDESDTGYSQLTWGWLNQLNSYVWETNPPDLWEQTDTFNKTAIASPAKGFSFNAEPVINQITACTNVVDKYHNALTNGQLDPAIAIPAFLAELEASGIDDIIAEKQAQLDAWAAGR